MIAGGGGHCGNGYGGICTGNPALLFASGAADCLTRGAPSFDFREMNMFKLFGTIFLKKTHLSHSLAVTVSVVF